MPIIELTSGVSTLTLPLTLVAPTGKEFGIATGFVYEYEKYYYLITNGHVLTNFNEEDNVRVSNKAVFPISLKTKFMTMLGMFDSLDDASKERVAELALKSGVDKNSTALVMPFSEHKIRLYRDEDYTVPTWYIHPDFGYKVDVVVIPLISADELDKRLIITGFNTRVNSQFSLSVTDDVYILGYPFGITNSLQTPIWKKGSIASEPNYPYKGLPRLLVDTATRSGMSGSPVIIMRPDMNDPHYGFVGVYSGRIGQETGAQLGIVWRKEVIEEIIKAKILGTTEFQHK
jgi:hypothetical protein